jgi:hypothetical protein
MRWPAAWAFAAVCTVGCHSTSPALDPFLPSTRIPPPATGTAGGTGEPYYTNPAPPFNASPPAYPPPPAAVPPGAGGSPYTPPGGYQYQPPTARGGGAGMNATPGPVQGASLHIVPPVGGQSADGDVVLAAHQEASQYGETLDGTVTKAGGGSSASSATKKKARRKSPIVRVSHAEVVDGGNATVYERGKASAVQADDGQSQPVDLMDLPAVSSAAR